MPDGQPIAEARQGPIRAVLEAQGAALSLFTQREANTAVREALEAGGDFWVRVFLPMRFSDYARKLGYRVKPTTAKAKALLSGRAVPFVQTGQLQQMAIPGAWARATATGGLGTIWIRIPRPHALRPEFAQVFTTVPTWEINRIAEVVETALAQIIQGSVQTTDRKGRQVARLIGPRTAARVSPNRRPAQRSRRRA